MDASHDSRTALSWSQFLAFVLGEIIGSYCSVRVYGSGGSAGATLVVTGTVSQTFEVFTDARLDRPIWLAVGPALLELDPRKVNAIFCDRDAMLVEIEMSSGEAVEIDRGDAPPWTDYGSLAQ